MITGFNPTDMYAVDHIRRVLVDVPGSLFRHRRIHDSQGICVVQVSGEVASLTNPALDRILDFAADVGLVVLIHNDITTALRKESDKPVYLEQMVALLKRHPRTTIVWAHTGLAASCFPFDTTRLHWRQFSRTQIASTFVSTFRGIRWRDTF